MTERSSWDLETGLKPAFDMTIQNAVYESDTNYMDGNVLVLVLTGTDGDGDEQRLLYSTGSPGVWGPRQGGAIAVREDGAPGRSFNQNSAVGTLISAAREAMGNAGVDLTQRGQAWEAGIWKGLTFHFERPQGNEQYKAKAPMPVTFLGEGQLAVAPAGAAPAQAPAQAQAAPAAAPAGTLTANGAVDGLTMAKLKANAKKATDWNEWMETCLHQGLSDTNPAVETILADEEQFKALRAS